jgi:hypothetical protein
VAKEPAALQRMSVSALREKHAEVFGEVTTTGNRTWLLRRIAWRVQANAKGDLSERAKARAAELARDADLRVLPPREKPTVLPMACGTRTGTLPQRRPTTGSPAGDGAHSQVQGQHGSGEGAGAGFRVRRRGLRLPQRRGEGGHGSHCNGFLFFGLTKGGDK